MADNIDVAAAIANLTLALEKMNEKISKIEDNSFYIDEFRKSKNAKFKTFADLVKKEFKDYLSKLVGGVGGGGTPEGSSSELVESGAKKIGGPVSKVRIEEVNPAVFKMLRDVIMGLMPKEKEEEKEKKKSNFLWGLLALLTGIVVGVIEFIGGWFNRIRKLISNLKVFQWLRDAFMTLKSRIVNAAGRIAKMIRESKLFKRLEGIWKALIASIKESSLFKKIRTFFSEESFLGKLFKRIGAFFRGEGKAGSAIKLISKALSGIGSSVQKGASFFMRIAKTVGGIGKTIFNALKKTPLFKLGKIIGRALAPIFLVVDLITNTIKSVKEQGFSFKAVLDGLLGGIVSFFTLGILNFENIKKLTDKITAAFAEGNIVEGVMRIILAVPDLIFQGIGKIATWIAGKIFGEDVKKKVQDFFKGDFTGKIFGLIKKAIDIFLWPLRTMIKFIKDKFNIDIIGWAKDMLDKAPGWVKKLVGWVSGDLKEREDTPAPEKKKEEPAENKKGFFSGMFNNDEQPAPQEEVEKVDETPEFVVEKEPDFETEDVEPEYVNNTEESADTEHLSSISEGNDKMIELLQKQLEIMTETKVYLEKLQPGNNVATSVNNQSVVNMTGGGGVNTWRQSVLSK